MTENYAFDTATDFLDHLLGRTSAGGPTQSAYWKRFLQNPTQAAQAQAATAPRMGVNSEFDPQSQAAMLASIRGGQQATPQFPDVVPEVQSSSQEPISAPAPSPDMGGVAEDISSGGSRETGPASTSILSPAGPRPRAAAEARPDPRAPIVGFQGQGLDGK